jgi:hypothetical protein
MRKTIDLVPCPFCPCQATASLSPSPTGDYTYLLEVQRWIDFGELKASDTPAWDQLRGLGPDEGDQGRPMMRDLNLL